MDVDDQARVRHRNHQRLRFAAKPSKLDIIVDISTSHRLKTMELQKSNPTINKLSPSNLPSNLILIASRFNVQKLCLKTFAGKFCIKWDTFIQKKLKEQFNMFSTNFTKYLLISHKFQNAQKLHPGNGHNLEKIGTVYRISCYYSIREIVAVWRGL